jgi:protein-disulfide isomerase
VSNVRPLATASRRAQEAEQVGLRGTPVLFINGVEVVGLKSVSALRNMLAMLQAADLPSRTTDFDRSALLADSRYGQWLKQPPVDIPAGKCRWHVSAADAPIRVVLFLDCQPRASARLAAQARQWAAERSDVRAEFYHFPFSVEAHAPHCLVEAAGRVGGPDAFWRMHDWFCRQGEEGTVEKGLAAAESLQLDRHKLAAELAPKPTSQAVAPTSASACSVKRRAPRECSSTAGLCGRTCSPRT